MKNGKSPGPGNINLELIKYGENKVYYVINKIIEQNINGREHPRRNENRIFSTAS